MEQKNSESSASAVRHKVILCMIVQTIQSSMTIVFLATFSVMKHEMSQNMFYAKSTNFCMRSVSLYCNM